VAGRESLLNSRRQSQKRRELKVLLDTNIVFHRETKDPTKEEIGKLFLWIDRLGYEKCVHQITINEISKRQDPAARRAFLTKIQSHNLLPTQVPLKNEVRARGVRCTCQYCGKDFITEGIEVDTRESRKLQGEIQRRRKREIEASKEHE
jgi:hypothetical protein